MATSAKWHRRASFIFVVFVSFDMFSRRQHAMQRLISAFILSKLDYCNSVLAGLPAATLSPLQRVMNAAVRLVANLGFRDPVSASMKELHWLPITYRIKYKLCIMMYSAVHGNCPAYITEILVPTSTLLNRARLRSSSSGTYDVPRVRTQFGKRAFSIAGPTAWNELPVASGIQAQ